VVLQRFGGALNLNLHFHALILDGVVAPGAGGELLATIEPLVARQLRLCELAGDADDAVSGWAAEAPAAHVPEVCPRQRHAKG
jgi:hypothetical protein